MGHNSISKSPVLKDFISKKKILITYVRDIYGFRKGIVIAIGRTKLGYSLVKSNEDVEWRRVKSHQLPVIQRMIQQGAPQEEIANSPAYVKCERADHLVKVPLFDQRIGLLLALDSAMRSNVPILDEIVDEPILAYDWLPHDDDLRKVVIGMFERAQKYFKKEK